VPAPAACRLLRCRMHARYGAGQCDKKTNVASYTNYIGPVLGAFSDAKLLNKIQKNSTQWVHE
jgi:hypothetical protein